MVVPFNMTADYNIQMLEHTLLPPVSVVENQSMHFKRGNAVKLDLDASKELHKLSIVFTLLE